MRGKLCFAAAAAVTLILCVTHGGQFPRFLLAFELLLALALFLQVHLMKKKVTAGLKLPEMICHKGEPLPVEVELANSGFLPISRLWVELCCKDRCTGYVQGLSGAAMLEGRDRAMLRFELDSVYCGVLELKLERAVLWDFLGVFSAGCRMTGGMQELSVLPADPEKTEGFMGDPGGRTGDGGAVGKRSGEEYGDDYEIRTFRRGDTLRRIHWNLTAKTDELVVRDFGSRMEESTLVLLDLGYDKERPTREQWDRFLETVAGVSRKLLAAGYSHEVIWADREASRICRMPVTGEEERQWMLCGLLRASVYEAGDFGMYEKENFADEASVEIIRIDLQGTVRREGRKEF